MEDNMIDFTEESAAPSDGLCQACVIESGPNPKKPIPKARERGMCRSHLRWLARMEVPVDIDPCPRCVAERATEVRSVEADGQCWRHASDETEVVFSENAAMPLAQKEDRRAAERLAKEQEEKKVQEEKERRKVERLAKAKAAAERKAEREEARKAREAEAAERKRIREEAAAAKLAAQKEAEALQAQREADEKEMRERDAQIALQASLPASDTCIEDCEEKVAVWWYVWKRRGLCRKHYERARRRRIHDHDCDVVMCARARAAEAEAEAIA